MSITSISLEVLFVSKWSVELLWKIRNIAGEKLLEIILPDIKLPETHMTGMTGNITRDTYDW